MASAAHHIEQTALRQGTGLRQLQSSRTKSRKLRAAAHHLNELAAQIATQPATSTSLARTRVRRCAPGVRIVRESPLTPEALWLNDERPPAAEEVHPDDQCGLCGSLKSHPVS
jgi:hypothetical protein